MNDRMTTTAAAPQPVWVANTTAGRYPYRIVDWDRVYSHHATYEAACDQLDQAAAAQHAFHANQRELDTVDRKVLTLLYGGLHRAYGSLSVGPADEPCGVCPHMLGDHHSDSRGCSYASCGCAVEDLA